MPVASKTLRLPSPIKKPPADSGVESRRRKSSTIAHFNQRGIDTSLGKQRTSAFAARLADQPGASDSSQLIDTLAVLAIRFTEATVLAGQATEDNSDSTMARLLDEIEKAASQQGIGYLKFHGDQVIASIEPSEHDDHGLQPLIEFALDVKLLCERRLAQQHAGLSFRIGIDLGSVVGSMVGRVQRTFTFWGEAAQMAAQMADTSLPGAIQVTRPVYQQLQHDYLFQQRGYHYLEGVGEFATYLLSGHL